MAKAGLPMAVCTAALLAAVPAFAQTNTSPADTGPGNAPNSPSAYDSTSGRGSNMSPGMRSSSDDNQSMGAMDRESTHRSAMTRHGAMGGREDTSQNAAVDRLNEQSFQAAQSGQTYGGSNMGPGGSSSMYGGRSGRATGDVRGGDGGGGGGGGGGGSGGSGM